MLYATSVHQTTKQLHAVTIRSRKLGRGLTNSISCQEQSIVERITLSNSLTDLIHRPPITVVVSQFVRGEDALSSLKNGVDSI